ncbi:aminoglycoside phosphotransferase family protein [Moorena sp. SIO2C4]|uniref:phosphotransferase family protein n=1 Tax=Moorena sp. SIO2C4 TaxID=2607824 RepID=UPI0013CD3B2E|nr:aminoglycoside phosphotransferase family protein [Moorena sp. SIO2C4]NES40914.1 aminoglycoside phosphotransferase family protein [Moorena sp. SIO2C4]
MTIKLCSKNLSQYLIDTGLFSEQDLESMSIEFQGNSNWKIVLISDCQLVVKQDIHHHNSDTTNKIDNEWQLYRFFNSCPDLSYIISLYPEISYFNKTNSIMIYKYPKDYIDLESYYNNQKIFPIKIAELVGFTLAALHRDTLNSHNCCDFMNQTVEAKFRYQFPYPVYLEDRLDPETFFNSPPETYKFINLYQGHEWLRTAVKKLVLEHSHYCLTHNKPLLNNILIPWHWEELLSKSNKSEQSFAKMINWEDCSWGDPAFDLGTAIAGYFLLWLNSLIVHPDIELNKSLQLATIPLEIIQPSVVALTRVYLSSFPKVLEDCPEFTKRVIQFSGLALIYKIIAMIQSFSGFNNQSICLLQLAKSLICQPEESFKSVFGIKEYELL